MSETAEVRPLHRPSVVDALANALRSRILSGDLAPGAPLRETVLSDAYEVSRHTLRAALRVLASEGLSKKCTMSGVDREMRKGKDPSDHAPIWAEFDE